MSKEDERHLEQMIEIVARAIPKERDTAKLYRDTAKRSPREMLRLLFEKLATQSEEHETKLRAAMEVLRRELATLRSSGGSVAQQLESQGFNINIRRTLRLTREMQHLAQQGLVEANDPSCRHMYEQMVEMAQNLHSLAEGEAEKHITAEKWD
jgi:rubrerythrin